MQSDSTTSARPRPQRPFISRRTVAEIYIQAQGKCALCGKTVAVAEVSIDHIVPVSAGGSSHPSNLQLAHRHCNSERQTKDLELFRHTRELLDENGEPQYITIAEAAKELQVCDKTIRRMIARGRIPGRLIRTRYGLNWRVALGSPLGKEGRIDVDSLYSVKAAALRLGVSEKTIRRRIARGELKAHRLEGSYGPEWRIFIPDNNPVPLVTDSTEDLLEGISPAPLERIPTPPALPSPELDRLISSIDALQATNAELVAELRLAREERAKVDESRTRLPWWQRVLKLVPRKY